MQPRSQHEIRVLHVDDEPSITDLTVTFLEREDDQFSVETATSADEGLELISDPPPDCIVSDYNMLGMDGLEFLQAVRQDYPDLPFILFTGKGSEEVASEAIAADVTGYLQKGSGTERYELLANRILNAVQARHEAKRADRQQQLMRLTEFAGDTGGFELGVDSGNLLLTDGTRRLVSLPEGAHLSLEEAIELYHPNDQADVRQTVNRAAETGEQTRGTWRLQTLDGDDRLVDVTITPATEGDDVTTLRGAVHDITERKQRERELRAERRFIEQALDALDELFYVLNPDGTLRRWNERARERTGYTDRDLADMRAIELFPEDERETVADAIETTLADGQATVEADLRTADGDRWPYELTGARLTDEDGTVTGLVGVGRDLSERRQRERRFQALVEESNDIISILDADGVFEYQSPSVERILGHDPKETIGDTAWEYIHPDDRDTVMDTFEEWVSNPEMTATVEYRAQHADGSWRWMEGRGNNQLENPAVEGYVVNSWDITDRRDRQEELQDIKGQYQTLVENFPNGAVFLYDRGHRVVRAGGSELSEAGLSLEEIEGSTPHARYPPEIADELVRNIANTLAGESHRFEQEYQGEHYWIKTAPVRTGDGEITHAMAVSQNITDQVADRRELEHQNEWLEEFTSVVSHDLRNPLNVAQARTTMLQDRCYDDESREHLDKTVTALERMGSIIEDTLALARQGDTVAEMTPIQITSLVEQCWGGVETAGATLEIADEFTLRGDRERLRHIFENLFCNVVEHGGDDVAVRVGRAGEDRFYVEDDGPGIPPSDRKTVFEAGHTSGTGGTGFGLTIVKRIAEAHSWGVGITDGRSGGARFEFDTGDLISE
jgi:PAS domain S-box-containing protein